MPQLTHNQEYCSIARALELLGERWTLHILRDLLTGPKRFGELMELVVGITPKWLTTRLRALEEGGLVRRDGRLYELTASGKALRPVLEELSLWSTEYDPRPPRNGEIIIPAHDMWALEVYLNRTGATLEDPVSWTIDLGAHEAHTLQFDGHRWIWTPEASDTADVIVKTTPRRWSTLLFNAQSGRKSAQRGYQIHGDPKRCKQFRELFAIAANS